MEEPKQPTLTKAPELVRFVDAPYPEAAREQKLSGDVGMIVEILEDGTVGDVQVVRPAGHGFDEAAVKAVRQFIFSPAEFDGVPAPVRIEYTYRFAFTEPPPPEPTPEELAQQQQAQRPVSMKGRVLERASRKPIAGAFVACQNSAEETVTEPDGTFELRPAPGICNLQIASPSHFPVTRVEQIEAGQVLELTYYLMPKKYGQFQTVVRGERERREAVRRTLEREELQKVPGTFGDPLRVVQSLPGVARTPFGLGALIVRGAAPQETGVYIDGVQIPLLFHFLGGPSVINAEMLDRIDFFPGGFGPRYGRAIGGILDAGLRRPDPEAVHGAAQVSVLDAYAFVEAPVYGDT
ncbi:MAG: TonB family protein, partial [Myxococcales bacterium]